VVSTGWLTPRYVGALAAFGLFTFMPLWPVCVLVRNHAGLLLSTWEANVTTTELGQEPYLGVGPFQVRVDARCTGLNLIAAAALLSWDARPGVGRCVLRMGMTSLILYTANIARIALTVSLSLKGWHWFLCHDVPYVIMVSLACVCVARMHEMLATANRRTISRGTEGIRHQDDLDAG